MGVLDQYGLYIAAGVIVLIVLYFLKNRPKTGLKPINRNEIERENFIRRMEFNDTPYKWIEMNGKKKYRILKLQPSEKDTISVFEFVLKPVLYGLFAYGKSNAYVFNAANFKFYTAKQDTIFLNNGVTAWNYGGIFYDNSFSNDFISYFKRTYTALTDWENLSSQYYASSQEASVVDPDRAHATLGAHLEIERIKEERKKQQLGS
jgi:hypothetical protein